MAKTSGPYRVPSALSIQLPDSSGRWYETGEEVPSGHSMMRVQMIVPVLRWHNGQETEGHITVRVIVPYGTRAKAIGETLAVKIEDYISRGNYIRLR